MDTTKYPATRGEAKRLQTKYYFTGMPCKHGHIALRKIKGECVECCKLASKIRTTERKEYFSSYNKSQRGKEVKHNHYMANKEVYFGRAYARPVEDKRQYHKNWKLKNKEYVAADTKNRRRKHREATPLWLTQAQKSEMRELYKTAIELTKTTGVQYAVDHIYPLRSALVCGLHVPWNLQIIRRDLNLLKSNKLPDQDMALAFP